MLLSKNRLKLIFLSGLLILMGLFYLFNGFKSEINYIAVKIRYSPDSFPEYITYQTKKGLYEYRGDLKFDKNTIRKDDKNTYYAQYLGTLQNKGLSIFK